MTAPYQTVVSRIQQLSHEQHDIYLSGARRGLSDRQRRRLAEIKAHLQRLWLERKHGRTHLRDVLDDYSEGRKWD